MLIGIPGCGKTSFCKQFFPKLTRISRDDIGDTTKEYRIILKKLEQNTDFAIDDINHTKNKRRNIFEMAKPFNAKVTGIFFAFNADRCIAQNSKRQKPIPDTVIGRINKELEPPSMDEGFTHIQILNNNFRF